MNGTVPYTKATILQAENIAPTEPVARAVDPTQVSHLIILNPHCFGGVEVLLQSIMLSLPLTLNVLSLDKTISFKSLCCIATNYYYYNSISPA